MDFDKKKKKRSEEEGEYDLETIVAVKKRT